MDAVRATGSEAPPAFAPTPRDLPSALPTSSLSSRMAARRRDRQRVRDGKGIDTPAKPSRHNELLQIELESIKEEREKREARLHRALQRLATGEDQEPTPSPAASPLKPKRTAVPKRGPRARPDTPSSFAKVPTEDAEPGSRPALPNLGHLLARQPPSPLSLSTGTPSTAAGRIDGQPSLPPRMNSHALSHLQRVDLHGTPGANVLGGLQEFLQASLPPNVNVAGPVPHSTSSSESTFARSPIFSTAAPRSTLETQGSGIVQLASDASRQDESFYLDMDDAPTRQRLRRWLSRENRASQVLQILQSAPANFRQALTLLLERLLCGDEEDESDVVTMLGSETSMVKSLGTALMVHEAPLLAQPAVPQLQMAFAIPRTGPIAHRSGDSHSVVVSSATPAHQLGNPNAQRGPSPGSPNAQTPRSSRSRGLLISFRKSHDGNDTEVTAVELSP